MLGGLETGLLWGNLGASLLVIVAGAVLVPALSLPDALVAILLGCVIGNLMLATAGLIGADARVPGMTLMRAPLGQRGSLLPTGINVLQGVGWTIFELLVIAHRCGRALGRALRVPRAVAVDDRLRRLRARPRAARADRVRPHGSSAASRSGPCRSRSLYLTWWALDGADLGALWDAEGEGGLSVWQGADVVVGITVSCVPYAADYTRFSKTRRGAFAGTGIGYFTLDAWLLALGAVLVLSRDLGDPAALPAAVVAGGFAAIVALFALLVTETDEAFANAYSAAMSLQNAFPRAPQALLIVLVTGVATARGARHRHGELPELPAPARLRLRAALRGAARRLARGGRALHGRTTSSTRPPGVPGSSPPGSPDSRSTSGSSRPGLRGGSISSRS